MKIHRVETKKIRVEVSLRQKTSHITPFDSSFIMFRRVHWQICNESFQRRLKRLGEGLAPDTYGANIPPSFCATRLVGGLLFGQLAEPSF